MFNNAYCRSTDLPGICRIQAGNFQHDVVSGVEVVKVHQVCIWRGLLATRDSAFETVPRAIQRRDHTEARHTPAVAECIHQIQPTVRELSLSNIQKRENGGDSEL